MKKFYVGVKGFITKDGKILLLQKAGEGFWEAPGGRIDGDETIEEALSRELHEEVPNIKDIEIKDILGAHRLQKDIDGDTSLVLMYYLVRADIDGEPELSDEHDDYMWADRDEALKRMVDKREIIESVFKEL